MAQRTGVPTLMHWAAFLCKGLTKFTPILVRLYGDNATLMAALAAASASCSVLLQELAAVREYGD